jgi:hypothetical protein
MQKSFFLFLLGLAILSGACNKEGNNLLQLDGENATGPLLSAGPHETAVRFSPEQTRKFNGKNLSAVLWYTGPRAGSTEVRVYGPGTGNTPGTLLYTKDVSSSVRPFSWNEHTLSAPIPIKGDEEIWIGIAFVLASEGLTIGCDDGPNRSGGDWLFSNDNQWRTYLARTGESINWNIRGKISD